MKTTMGLAKSADILDGQPYTLTVRNMNSKLQQFALFQTIPNIPGPSKSPLSLAWMLGTAAGSRDSKNNSYAEFFWQIDYAVTTGYVHELGSTLNPRRFSAASDIAANVDTQNRLEITYMGSFPNGVPAFPKAPEKGESGLITVGADDTIPTAVQQSSVETSLNVGISMDGKPTVVMQLLPNETYRFTPHPTYYIISGAFIQGQVIDTAISTSAFQVEYREGVTNRTVIFTEKNQFEDA